MEHGAGGMVAGGLGLRATRDKDSGVQAAPDGTVGCGMGPQRARGWECGRLIVLPAVTVRRECARCKGSLGWIKCSDGMMVYEMLSLVSSQ